MAIIQLQKGRELALSDPQIMGILNVTPDSFSDGGSYSVLENALLQAERMLADGAAIIDIGGESTRPGAPHVSLEQELQRVIPAITAIRMRFDCIISIDTSKAEVMRQALDAGADIINDVRALQEPGALEVAAQSGAPVCLMHMQGQPRTMQAAPLYGDVVADVKAFLAQRVEACLQAGIQENKIILDPGFGFGKNLAHNYEVLGRLDEFCRMGFPVLSGLSRKSMFGQLLNRETDERLAASLAGALISAQKGARIIRVHDVKETADVLAVWAACEKGVAQ